MLVWILMAFMALVAILCVAAYFKFKSLRKQARTLWVRLDEQLKRRRDLLPVIILTAAALPNLDKKTVQQLTEAKDNYLTSSQPTVRAKMEEQITTCLRAFCKTVTKNEDIQQDEYIHRICKQIYKNEGNIRSYIKKYNTAAQEFNTLAGIVPFNLLAYFFEFNRYEYFSK